MNKILPSIITANYLDLRDNLKRLTNVGLKELHLDIMDGSFVPNITFGHKIASDIHKEFPELLLDAHLMTLYPDYKVDKFIEAGVSTITIHMETVNKKELLEIKTKVKNAGIKFGIAVGYETDIKKAFKILDNNKDIDLVLVMSVKQGEGGQTFDDETLSKISSLTTYRKEKELKFEIEVDGGINTDNYNRVIDRGVDKVVAGNAIFKDNNIEDNYNSFNM